MDVDEATDVSQITKGLYQSGFVATFPPDVQAVMCLNPPDEMAWALAHGYPNPFDLDLFAYAWRPIKDDSYKVPSLRWLDSVAAEIQSWRDMGWTVLTHCAAGISRSSMVNAAYLMRRYRWPAAHAIQFVKVARPITEPNAGFRKLLGEYEQHLAAQAA